MPGWEVRILDVADAGQFGGEGVAGVDPFHKER